MLVEPAPHVELDERDREAAVRGRLAAAWASYEDPQAWCANATEGELWWWPAGEAAALRVSPVGSGCLCCGAYWPALQVDLGADVLAWSYGRGREAPAIGVARRRCE